MGIGRAVSKELIAPDAYKKCLTELSRFNGRSIRLPENEIRKRLDGLERRSCKNP